MFSTKIVLGRVDVYFPKNPKIGIAIRITSGLIEHVIAQFFGKPTDVFLSADAIEEHTPRGLHFVTDRHLATDFRDFSKEYIGLFLPALIAQSPFPLIPEVMRVPAAEVSGFGLNIRLPLEGVPHRCLEAWYVHPHKWSLNKSDAMTYETYDQALNVLNGKEPQTFLQDQLIT